MIRSRAWLERAVARGAAAPPPDRSREPILGIDVADGGAARTAVAVLTGPGRIVREVTAWDEDDQVRNTQRVIALAHRWGLRPKTGAGPGWGWLVVDVVEPGTGMCAMLRHAGYKTIEFAGSEKPQSGGVGGIEFVNRRVEAFWAVRTMLEGGTLALPNDEEVFAELLALKWHPAATGGRVELEPKKDWVARVGRSPDKADALSMAVVQTADDELVGFFHALAARSDGGAFW